MSLIARMAYNPQLVWCLIAGSKEKISTEHMLSIWEKFGISPLSEVGFAIFAIKQMGFAILPL